METTGRKLAVTLAIAAIFLSLSMSNVRLVRSESLNGGNIDLYTQKEPYGGTGSNTTSDSFSFGEEVQIHALVKYNDYPVVGVLVAFQISGPRNQFENISIYRAVSTNQLGLATTSFRISLMNESTFGEWAAFGSARIGNSDYTDNVSFKVGWIVEIISLRTVDENHMEQDKFTRGKTVGVKLSMRNIAMTEKSVALTVTICDYFGITVNATELSGFAVPPNGTLVYAYFSLDIPRTASEGNATVYACAFTALPANNGVPYCPEVSKSFTISSIYMLTIVATAGGTTDPLPGVYSYASNSTIQVSAIANTNYVFVHWELDSSVVDSNTPYLVTMDGDHTLKASFRLSPSGWFNLEWSFWISMSLLLILFAILLLALWYRRRRRSEDAFYSGWTAWYYQCDLDGRNQRT